MDHPLDLPAHALSSALHARRISCRELMHATLDRIAALNPRHNAIVSLREGDVLLAEADARDAELARGFSRGWLHGIPQAIKDMAATAGLTTTLGSPLYRDAVPAQDALMVARMKAAGCIVIGKTNTPEFGLGSHTFNEVFGVTRNAWDPARSAGGSSGGAAVALALRLLAVADGSDYMGSLRNPAGWNHVYGLRPSQGRVPAWPAQDAWIAVLSTEGPMARSVRDLALLLDTQAGPDPRAPLSIAEAPAFAAALDGATEADGRVRIGWLGDLDGHLAMEDGVLDVCAGALRTFEDLGAAVEPAALPMDPERVWQAWLAWRHTTVAARIAAHLRTPADRARMKPEALWEHDGAAAYTASDLLRASAERTAFHAAMLDLLAHFDVLALPTAQVWPFAADERWPREIAGRTMDTYHRWMEVVIHATFAGLPCLALPAGFDERGLPMGLQLIGRPRGEAALLRIGAAYEIAAAGLLARRPPGT